MDQGIVIGLAQRALNTVLLVSAPMLGFSLLVGVTISIFQATTQIQEQTLTFVPKILAVIAAVALFGSWMLRVLIEYTQDLFLHINDFL
ncbi:flagellar biosynthetic protein FliQ [Anaerobacterium chartisolvens]|uniref:Flagellar biosynthetic protein FliQ n=1 Tax=Anaerobacterium chartisolvens TaxID=1297424 RepID=A0A369B4P3_9FIRM|nr:flagellar biosynthesis protein FliQ [Anaerobacterium chartisolvens]RCX15527.1 flagellar biosynthetic protein FliQ [Anaerobacterium chartisolvens]